jgi:tetratricopeptide (TPR) repeat protein
MKPEKSSANNNLGLSLFEMQDYEKAIEYYGKAINVDKSSVHYSNRGLAFYHMGDLDRALDDFNSAWKKDPNDP